MKKISWIVLILIFVLSTIVIVRYGISSTGTVASPPPNVPASSSNVTNPTPNPPATPVTNQNTNSLADPVANFRSRVTKKPFGIYITPQNSPISPERFTGYHTGADAEYQDVSVDVPVYAVANGKIVLSETALGYGGVFIMQTNIDGATRNVLYGHIRPSSLPKVGVTFVQGQQIALLGTGYSTETDGERRHLHFSVLSNTRLDIKGYVSKKADLSNWIDPLSLF